MKIILNRPIQFLFLSALLACFLQVSLYEIQINFFFPVNLLLNKIPIIFLFLSVSIAFVTNNIKVSLSSEFFVWLLLLNISLFIIPLLGLSLSIALNITDVSFDYNQIDYSGRILNLFFLTAFIFALHNIFFREEQYHIPIKFYWYGTTLLALTGIWQLLSFYSILPFPFETRSYVHTVKVETIAGRLTGMAAEPSYFVAFIADFMGLSFFILRSRKNILYLYLFISIICLYYAFSPSGYIILICSVTCPFFSMFLHKKTGKYLMALGPILFIGAIYFIQSDGGFYFLERLKIADENSRYLMLTMPFNLIFNSNLTTAIFGYGIKSYSIIGPSMDFASTSNNIFADTLCESGILGFLSLLAFFIYIYYSILKSIKISYTQKYIALFLFFDLLSSSIFRADYATLRFYILIYTIYVLTYVDIRKELK
ncbi:MAG: hypothetical protein D3911_11420 [Candidatus Electrothrix sp. AW3_4]|nr:hypothetical protein [Candidatus Electrothrix gigas]